MSQNRVGVEQRRERKTAAVSAFKGLVGSDMCFAAKEAYKLLRTNLRFALSDVDGCCVVGMSSSVRGEGKSLSSCNLAYTLAEAGERVLLLEGDLRIPTLSRKLNINSRPGLANLLVSRGNYEEYFQKIPVSVGKNNDLFFDVLVAGNVPPNPSEILGSQRMARLIETLKASYDYIIVDLPPITAVTDALVVSKLLHGVILVVREGTAERRGLRDAIRQLKLVNVRLLGFVYNGAGKNDSRYAYRSRYKYRYYKKDSRDR